MYWSGVAVVWRGRRNGWDWLALSQTAGLTLLPHHVPSRLKHSFLRHVQILWMMTFQNLEQSVQHVISVSKAKWEEQVFSPCSKKSVYHPFHPKPYSDYLKSQNFDLNEKNIRGYPMRSSIHKGLGSVWTLASIRQGKPNRRPKLLRFVQTEPIWGVTDDIFFFYQHERR
jgi:hypothetical protein